MKPAMLAFVLCLACVPALAQDERPSGLVSLMRFSAGQESESVSGGGEFSDTVILVSPSFDGLKRYTGTTELAFYYQPEFEMYVHNGSYNSLNHLGRVSLIQKITPRLTFAIGDSFAYTKDPSRQLANSFLLLPRARYKENSLYFSADYSISPRTSWQARFDNRIVRFGLDPEFRSGFLDQMGNSFSTGVAHQFNPRHRLGVTYALLRITLLDHESADPMARSANNHIISASYGYTFNPDLHFSVSAGAIRSDDYSYLFGAQITKRLGLMWLDASYNRSIGFGEPALTGPAAGLNPGLSNGLVGSNYYQAATVGLRGGITRRLGLDLRAGIIENSARASDFNSRSYMTLGRLSYHLSDRVVLFTTAELYSQNLNDFAGVPTRRTRFFGGLEIGLSPGSYAEALFPGSGIKSARPITDTPDPGDTTEDK